MDRLTWAHAVCRACRTVLLLRIQGGEMAGVEGGVGGGELRMSVRRKRKKILHRGYGATGVLTFKILYR